MGHSGRVVRTLRVMTFNIHAGIGTDGRYDLERVAALVTAQEPDLLGLQEVDRHYDTRSAFEDQPARLAELTGLLSSFGPTIARNAPSEGAPRREYGNLILSRFPISSSCSTALPSTLEERALLEVVVDLGVGVPLTFFDIHLGLGTGSLERAPQALAAAARVDAAAPPRILVGDANVQPPSEELVPLFDRLADVWPEVGSGEGATIPSDAPRWRIDLVLVERVMRPLRAWTIATDASDHLPVVCDVAVPGVDH